MPGMDRPFGEVHALSLPGRQVIRTMFNQNPAAFSQVQGNLGKKYGHWETGEGLFEWNKLFLACVKSE